MAAIHSNVIIRDLGFAVLNVHVSTTRGFGWRLWAGIQLLRLAGVVMGCNMVIKTEAQDGEKRVCGGG